MYELSLGTYYTVILFLANVTFPIAILGTDNYTSWIILTMCNKIQDEGGK